MFLRKKRKMRNWMKKRSRRMMKIVNPVIN
jgi:hypothetical protein